MPCQKIDCYVELAPPMILESAIALGTCACISLHGMLESLFRA